MKISYSIPAYLSNFSALDDKRTYADLKVFYVGETADGRIFDKEFANKLIETLPYTPVVAFYSDLKDDFIGHNSTQYIYGIVKHDANIRFEKDEEGVEWLITSLMLYTDRLDNIGEVAKRIVGKQHSLEMDPNKTRFEIIREDNKQKVKFLESSFLGLSVLGDSQKPAFTGSEFFNLKDFGDARERFENFFSFLQDEDRGEQMEREHFEKLSEFVKLSYTEKMTMVSNALRDQLGETYSFYLVDMNDERAVFMTYNWNTDKEEYHAYGYSITEEANVTFISDEIVYPVYVTMAEREYLDTFGKEQVFEESEEESKEETEEESTNSEESALDKSVEKEPEEEDDENTKKQTEENLNSVDPVTAALNHSERAELEGYRREKKVGLINSYSEELPSDILKEFKSKVDELTFTDLEVALALEFRKISMENKATSNEKNNIPFSFANVVTTTSSRERTYAEIIKSNVK